MSFLTEPLSRLKYGFPTLRQVEYDIDIEPDVKDDLSVDTEDEPELKIEYRDEKDRKWWSFFDEYEYRSNKFTRKKHKWYKWYNENNSPAERKLLFKLDIMLTLFSLMAYWVKYLDQTNLNNVYVVDEFKNTVGMKGNDLVNTQVMFNIGNIIFQIPFIYLLNVCPLNYLLPGFDIAWSIVTICLYKTTNVSTLKGLRFLIGALESQAYYSYHFLFGSWFTADELSRRAMIFYFGQYLGVLTSGLLSGAIVRNLDNVGGLQSWQWIFIIDGLISLAVGLIGIFSIPGTPTNCYSIFLTDEEIKLARRRLQKNNVSSKHKYDFKDIIDLKLWKDILSTWEIYVLSFWNIFLWNNSNASSGSYILWLKSLTSTDKNGVTTPRYSGGTLQDRSALTPGLGLIWLFVTCTFADSFHSRWGAILGSQIFNITGNAILAVWDVNESTKWFAWCLQYFGWACAPVVYSWQGDICRRDQRKRSIVLIIINAIAQSTTAFMAVIVWKTVDAPTYFKGFTFTACSAATLILWTFGVLYLYKRNEKSKAIENGIYLYNSSNADDIPEAVKSRDTVNEKEDEAIQSNELSSTSSN
ncbi:probable transporter Seo1p [[Candida] jaroonii]|uniref:Probable transporter Seo1p n=1 Tax=[Candida] jaroonii TaxID=467808 RepID=A0ACA9YAD0_9ASCO|nr:probable transporter Seo1p [[Candida] jaroonii]